MGAVTAIMYGDRDPSIAGLVLDSAFSSLKLLIEELVEERVSLPKFVLNQATKLVKSTVNKKAQFNLDDIEPVRYAERCFIPALFCHANNDAFVKIHHCDLLSKVYPGDKNVIKVEGDHNSTRPKFFRDSASIFFYNTLQVAFIKEISENYAGFKFMINKEEKKIQEEVKQTNVKNEIEILDNINEEEIFQQILQLSKKEYQEKTLNKDKEKENQQNIIQDIDKDKESSNGNVIKNEINESNKEKINDLK